MKFRAPRVALVAFVFMYGNGASAAPLAYGNYYDETASVVCGGGVNSCALYFSRTPLDKLVMVRQLKCYITSGTPATAAFLNIATAANGVGTIARNLPLPIPANIQQIGGGYNTSIDTDIHWLIGQGRFPWFYVQTFGPTTIGVNCTIVGDLIDPIS